jgi:response regulator RpfG family c-di-GMP phosphodiesterase
MNDNVLLVDDDIEILSGFQRNLRKFFKIKTASSAKEAIDIIKESPSFAVVVSDFDMPNINGTEFFSLVRKIHPDTVRIILTGYANLDNAIDAINEGNVFRFLTKPINTEKLINVIKDSIEQHRLLTLEKELLSKTLKGSIKILIDILSAFNPEAFSLVSNVRKTARMLAEKLGMKNLWEIEIAALLSQIGFVTLPHETLQKKLKGEELSHTELGLINSLPQLSHDILDNIPRLETIADGILYQNRFYDGSDTKNNLILGENIPLISRILKISIDFNQYLLQGFLPDHAIIEMQNNSNIYDRRILEILFDNYNVKYHGYSLKSVPLRKLRIGMVLAQDILDVNNYVLVTKNYELNHILIIKLANVAKTRKIQEPIKVYEPIGYEN